MLKLQLVDYNRKYIISGAHLKAEIAITEMEAAQG